MGYILAINIGSTSTKIGIHGDSLSLRESFEYTKSQSLTVAEEHIHRKRDIEKFLNDENIEPLHCDIIVSRGGLMEPTPSGIYRINERMCSDLLSGRYGRHASALGPVIALEMAAERNCDAIVVDPPSTDELSDTARLSGMPEIPRQSAFHALSHKAAARAASRDMRRSYDEINLIVVHMGGGITVGAHERGRVVDATHGLSEGPFTPERAGGLPSLELVDLIFKRGYSRDEIHELLLRRGGLFGYLETKDAREIEGRIAAGDQEAERAYQAMAYQIAREIGSMAAVLGGDLDAIVLTGGLTHSATLTAWITGRVRFLGPVMIYPGEDEISALIDAGRRILQKEEEARDYPPE